MAGGYYTALSGMRTRMEALDRLASDIANASTAGYKTERAGTQQADRPTFDSMVQSAIDVTTQEARLDRRPGPVATTGRNLDVALEGPGYFAIQTPYGERYTRNGQFQRSAEGVLITPEGHPVAGVGGPIAIGQGEISIDGDGTVRAGASIAGKLKVVDFDPNVRLEREGGLLIRANGAAREAAGTHVTAGALESSNVSVVNRIAELTEVTRTYETLLRSVSVLFNDIDRGAINELGRKS